MVRRMPPLAAVAAAGLTLAAAEPSWEGKTVVLTRAGVRLQAPEGQDIPPKSAGEVCQ